MLFAPGLAMSRRLASQLRHESRSSSSMTVGQAGDDGSIHP
jgi:hypothetical protein